MEKVLFADLSEKERMQMLSDNADTVEEVGYRKPLLRRKWKQ